MKMSTLRAAQRILLINWFIAPALGIWIWIKSGNLIIGGCYFIIWLFLDKAWDWFTEILMAGVARVGANEEEEFEAWVSSEEVPIRLASMMIVDLLGTFILPWFIAGLFLVCT